MTVCVVYCASHGDHHSLPPGVERAVGYNNRNAQEEDRGSGVTTSQFFSRFPELHPFLLAGLRECAADALRAAGAGWVRSPSGVMSYAGPGPSWLPSHHPALHPLLLLLSRLRPDVSVGPTPSLSVSPFVSLVRLAAWQRHMHVRRMAARALAALLPEDELAESVHAICVAVAEAVDTNLTVFAASGYPFSSSRLRCLVPATAPPESEDALLDPSVLAAALIPRSWDALHGTLLQMNALLSRLVDGRGGRESQGLALTPSGNAHPGSASLLSASLAVVHPALRFLVSAAATAVSPAVVVGEANAALSALAVFAEVGAARETLKHLASTDQPLVASSLLSPRLLGECLFAAESGQRQVDDAISSLLGATSPHDVSRNAAEAVQRLENAILNTNDDLSCSAARNLQASLGRSPADTIDALWVTPILCASSHAFDGTSAAGMSVAQRLLASLVALLERTNAHPEAARSAASAAAALLSPLSSSGTGGSGSLGNSSRAAAAGDTRTWAILLQCHDRSQDGDLRGHCLRALGPLLAERSRHTSSSPQAVNVEAVLSLVVARALDAIGVVPNYALRLAGVFALRVSGALEPR